MKSNQKQTIHAVKEFYRALAAGDNGYAHTLLAPEIEWVEHGDDLYFSGRRSGRQIVIDEIIEPAHERIRQYELKPRSFFPVGDRVVVFGYETGRGRVTDIKLHAPFMHVWTVESRKLVRCEGFHDELEWQVVLGVTSVQTRQLAA